MTPQEKLAARIPIPWADVERIATAAHERFRARQPGRGYPLTRLPRDGTVHEKGAHA